MSNRVWILGAVLASIAIVVMGWVVGISPKLAEADTAAAQRQNVDSQNLAQEQANALLKDEFAKIKTYQDDLKKLQVSVPATDALNVFFDQIVADSTANGLVLDNLTALEAAIYGGSVDPTAATNPDTVKPAESTATDPNAPASGLSPTLTGRFFTIGVSLKGDRQRRSGHFALAKTLQAKGGCFWSPTSIHYRWRTGCNHHRVHLRGRRPPCRRSIATPCLPCSSAHRLSAHIPGGGVGNERHANHHPSPRSPTTKPEVIEDAVVVEEPAATTAPSEPPRSSLSSSTARLWTSPQVVYVQTPAPPPKKGNRGIGSVLIASGIIFAAAFALVVAAIANLSGIGRFTVTFLAQPSFYVPVLFYIIGAVLLVVIVNRAGWAAYTLGSIFVGLVVYFGTVGVLLLGQGVILKTPAEAAALLALGLTNPLVIAAGLVAREVSMWTGALISRRGRRLKVHNATAHRTWEREVAQKKAEHERTSAAATAV